MKVTTTWRYNDKLISCCGLLIKPAIIVSKSIRYRIIYDSSIGGFIDSIALSTQPLDKIISCSRLTTKLAIIVLTSPPYWIIYNFSIGLTLFACLLNQWSSTIVQPRMMLDGCILLPSYIVVPTWKGGESWREIRLPGTLDERGTTLSSLFIQVVHSRHYLFN